MIIGSFGAGIGMLVFGTATTYSQAVLGRALSGFLSGNIGVIKSFLTEITDHSNRPKGFSYLQVAWATGSILGPLIGGFFCYPALKYPTTFPANGVFGKLPFFFPTLLCAVMNFGSGLIVLLFMKEPPRKPVLIVATRGVSSVLSVSRPPGGKHSYEKLTAEESSIDKSVRGVASSRKDSELGGSEVDEEIVEVGSPDYEPISLDSGMESGYIYHEEDATTDAEDVGSISSRDIELRQLNKSYSDSSDAIKEAEAEISPPESRSVLSDKTVQLILACYGILSFGDVITVECIPLLCKLERQAGGLSLGSSDIGMGISAAGGAMLLFSLTVLPKIMQGSKLGVFRVCNAAAVVVVMLFPGIGLASEYITSSDASAHYVLMALLIGTLTVRTIVFTMTFTSVSAFWPDNALSCLTAA